MGERGTEDWEGWVIILCVMWWEEFRSSSGTGEWIGSGLTLTRWHMTIKSHSMRWAGERRYFKRFMSKDKDRETSLPLTVTSKTDLTWGNWIYYQSDRSRMMRNKNRVLKFLFPHLSSLARFYSWILLTPEWRGRTGNGGCAQFITCLWCSFDPSGGPQELSEQDRIARKFLAEIFLTRLSGKETKLRHDHQAVEDLHHPLDLLLLPVVERWRFLPQEKPLCLQPSTSFHGRQPGSVEEGKSNSGQLGVNKWWLSLSVSVPASVPWQSIAGPMPAHFSHQLVTKINYTDFKKVVAMPEQPLCFFLV